MDARAKKSRTGQKSVAEIEKNANFEGVRKRPYRSRPPAVRQLKKPSSPGGWSMIPIDGEPIRKKVRADYERVLRGTEKARDEIERYRTVDVPLYSKWLNSTFGTVLTETRELQAKLHDAQFLIEEVEAEFFLGRHSSLAAAYRKVMRRRTHPEEFAEEVKQAEKKADEARKRFEQFFGFSPDDEDDDFDPFGEEDPVMDERDFPPGLRRPAPKPETNGRLKDLYRNLVRKLHPDTGGERSARQMEWWHQTQEAYQQGNTEQLELILTLAEMEESGTKSASVSILQLITAKYKQGLNALRRELRRYKGDPAWSFSTLEDLGPVQERMRTQLESQRNHLTSLLKRCEATTALWAEQASRLAEPQAPRKRRSRQRAERPLEPNPWF